MEKLRYLLTNSLFPQEYAPEIESQLYWQSPFVRRSVDTTIAILPSHDSDRRLRVSLQGGDGPSGLQLIDESFSCDVGWYAQSSIHLAPEQVAALRLLLGSHGGSGKQRTNGQLAAMSDKPVLSIVRAG